MNKILIFSTLLFSFLLIFMSSLKKEDKACGQKYLVLSVGGCDSDGYCGVEVEPFPDKTTGVGPDIKILHYPAKNYLVCESQFVNKRKYNEE